MTTDALSVARKRKAVYWIVGFGLVIAPLTFHGSEWRGSAHLHTIMEALATQLAIAVGVLALVRYYSKKDNTFLLIGVGFLGTAFLDGYHALVTSETFKPLMPSDLPALIPWSWVASRLFLSVVMFLSWAAWCREQKLGPRGRIGDRKVYFSVAAFTITFFLVFPFAPLPPAYYPDAFFHRPEEFIPALFFGLALVGYWRKGLWRDDQFEHWVMLSLIVGFVSQFVFMSHSGLLFDYEFDLAHLLKKVSYLCVLVGLFFSVYATFRQVDGLSERLSSIVDNAVDGIITINPQGMVTTANPAFLEMFGLDAKTLSGASVSLAEVFRVKRGPEKTRLVSVFDLLRTSGKIEEIVGLTRQGREFPVEISVSSMSDNGQISYIGLVRDITKRRKSEQRLSAFVENTVDGIVTIDARGVIESVNPAVQVLFGYEAMELLGLDVKILLPVDERDDHQGFVANSDLHAARVINRTRDLEGRRKDGTTFPIGLTVTRMEYDGETKFAGIIRDITERKKAEQLKNEFVSTVSHELRTPLTSIKGSLGLIEAGAVGELPPELKSMVDIAFKNSERLVRLINDILDIEKIEAGKMEFRLEVHNLSTLLVSAIEANSAFADQYGVTLKLTDMVPGDRIYGDADRLQQVFANLLSNAVKFSPEGSRVNISVSRIKTGFRIAFRDRGRGISDEFREHIFEKFSQVDGSDSREKGGTGLGLNIAKTIVETHKGKIYFESNPAGGTVFFVELPEWRGTAEESDFAARKPMGPKVLICEDEPDIAALLSFVVRAGGYHPVTAGTAAEAKVLLAKQQFLAMTLDIRLPGQDGISLFHELRGDPKTRDLPVIVISAIPDGEKQLNGDAIGLVDWLVKPIDQDRLMQSLEFARRHAGGMPNILHVEDDADVCRIVSALLDGVARVTSAHGFTDATTALNADDFDLVILDLDLPDGDGEDLLPLLRRRDRTSIPVVVFSAKEISGAVVERVSASLVKTQTSNESLLRTIRSTIDAYSRQPAGVEG